MAAGEHFQNIVNLLESAGIASMVVGSYASSYYGSPRATQDFDVVISASESQVRDFIGNLAVDRYYVNLNTALDALVRKSMFNVLDLKSGWKFDFIFCKSRPFSLSSAAGLGQKSTECKHSLRQPRTLSFRSWSGDNARNRRVNWKMLQSMISA